MGEEEERQKGEMEEKREHGWGETSPHWEANLVGPATDA